jgi:hypothetical protein
MERGVTLAKCPGMLSLTTRHILFFVEPTAFKAQGPTRGLPIRSITSCSAALTALLKGIPRCSIPPVFTTSSALLWSSFEPDLSQFRPCFLVCPSYFAYFCSSISAFESLRLCCSAEIVHLTFSLSCGLVSVFSFRFTSGAGVAVLINQGSKRPLSVMWIGWLC